jgi:glycine/D-amino acid oxidase-like deaminating enzyme/nitrite reductase/ring-hydroxylating ferredoxin subunit
VVAAEILDAHGPKPARVWRLTFLWPERPTRRLVTSLVCGAERGEPIFLCALVPLPLRETAKGNKPDHGDDDAEQHAPDQSDDDPCNDKDPAEADADAAACVPALRFMRSHQFSLFKGEPYACPFRSGPNRDLAVTRWLPMPRDGEIHGIDASDPSRSLWPATAEIDEFPALDGDVEVDVAVVGAGITGVTVAHLLKREGRTVALLDMRRIGLGTTGHTTAKLTVGHSLVYAKLTSSHGPDAARLYAESNREAISQMNTLAADLGINCDWEPASNYVYTESSGRVDQLEKELEAVRSAGILAEMTRETDLPFPVAGAIRVDDQAQFHPLKYLAGLVARIPGDGSHVFEQTRATAVKTGETATVETSSGRVLAKHVVVATQLPFPDRGLFFAKAHPQKSFAVSAEMEEARTPRGMYISIDEPTRSIRSAPAGEAGRHLIVGGEGRRPGDQEDDEQAYHALEELMKAEFGVEPELRWSAHDYVPVDGLPYIGRLRRRDESIHVATGFAKWGLSKATIAARIITDTIVGRSNRWAALYDTRRLTPRASASSFVAENARVARRFVGDRLRPRPEDARLAAGDGAIIRAGHRHHAVYCDESGTKHVLSARCPHLGCLVAWSEADKGWECPCHGSRFTAEGELLQGPATTGLEREPAGQETSP